MKINNYKNYKVNQYRTFDKKIKNQMSNQAQNSLNFSGKNITNVLDDKFINKFTNGSQGIINAIDTAIGKDGDSGYFTKLLKEAKINDLDIKKYTYIEGLKETLKTPLDILNAISKKIAGENNVIFKNRYNEKKQYDAFFKAREIVEVFQKCNNNNEDFNERVATELSNLAKNYSTRDERTLNRIATSTVSALFSGNDFFNISMLQKDDTQEAKKAEKGRLKQELKRMAITAFLTFSSLGILDKKTKSNLYTNVSVMIASALASEILSRITSKTSLTPLSSEKAAKIAKKNKEKTQNNTSQTTQPQTNTQTKNNSDAVNLQEYDNLFGKIYSNSSQGNAFKKLLKNISQQQETNKSSKSKKLNIKKMILLTFAASNALFWLGQLKVGKSHKNLNEYPKMVSDYICKQNTQVDLDKLRNHLDKLKQDPRSSEISMILNQYSSFIETFGSKNIIHVKEKRVGISGFYDGLVKIPKTIYTLFSAPSKLIVGEKKQDPLKELAKSRNQALLTLQKIISDRINDRNISGDELYSKIIDDIKLNTRNIATQQNTADIANLSRTGITAISTYFFINDYRNKVLIESEGKDIEGANEEMRERFFHKLANFVINGTLMNLGNSIFEKQLNSSLLYATIIPFVTEILNESAIRKFICQPIGKMNSREEIINYETEKLAKGGISGAWSRTFKKMTGKKSLTEKMQTQQTK